VKEMCCPFLVSENRIEIFLGNGSYGSKVTASKML